MEGGTVWDIHPDDKEGMLNYLKSLSKSIAETKSYPVDDKVLSVDDLIFEIENESEVDFKVAKFIVTDVRADLFRSLNKEGRLKAGYVELGPQASITEYCKNLTDHLVNPDEPSGFVADKACTLKEAYEHIQEKGGFYGLAFFELELWGP